MHTRLKIYENKSPVARIIPSELISLKPVNASSVNEKTLVRHEINTASADFLAPPNLKTE